MPYPEGHKEKVRKRIIESAGTAFRVHGIQATSVPSIMKGAGLTHGGFYAHFDSKEQLLSETCQCIVSDTLSQLRDVIDTHRNEPPIHAVVRHYLSPEHRDEAATGCIFPILTSEMSRSSNEEIRDIYNRELKRFIDFLAELSGKDKQTAGALLSIMVGTVMLSRTADQSNLSDSILEGGLKQALAMVS